MRITDGCKKIHVNTAVAQFNNKHPEDARPPIVVNVDGREGHLSDYVVIWGPCKVISQPGETPSVYILTLGPVDV